MEYTPNPAATRTTTAATAPAVTPSLCFFAMSTAELLVVCPDVGPEVCPNACPDVCPEACACAGIVAAIVPDADAVPETGVLMPFRRSHAAELRPIPSRRACRRQ